MMSDLPDFQKYRNEKQQQADTELKELLLSYQEWLKQHTNLREKVRAKHLFAEKVHCSMEDVDKRPWKDYFEEWFAFDYITIIGTRLFDMYVKESAEEMEPIKIQLSGLLLLAVWEPCYLLETQRNGFLVSSLFTGEKKVLSTFSTLWGEQELSSLSSSVLLIRYVHCGFENRIFRPPIPLEVPEEELNRIDQMMTEKIREKEGLRYLKEKGINWLRYATSGKSGSI